uniref:Hydrogen voltage-gated channel 1 n=1 Tax=Tetraselmis chuii TaxID=63592 RepID=A0A7S1SYW7_9CHLO|mmetsp:Transcript_32848/g.58872  ORF Transcript_32848/g.58872 Transcript_32848/m.58872 type:complete len:124 (+) Transcript_32848:2-373(+)
MAAIGWFFFRHFFFILDVFVVTVSLALEMVAVASAHMGLVVGNILIIARMWRFFRVAHGIYFLDHRSDHRSEAVQVTMSKSGGEARKQTEGTYDTIDMYRDGANMGVGVDGRIRAGSCPPIED